MLVNARINVSSQQGALISRLVYAKKESFVFFFALLSLDDVELGVGDGKSAPGDDAIGWSDGTS